jgi:hypothetical protein
MVCCVDRGPQAAAAAGRNLAGVSYVDMFNSQYVFNMTIIITFALEIAITERTLFGAKGVSLT